MSFGYDDMDASDFARVLTHGAKKACLKLTAEWKSAKEVYAHHNGAEFLHWQYQNRDKVHLLCEKQKSKDSDKYGTLNNYRLTPLGVEVQTILKSGED